MNDLITTADLAEREGVTVQAIAQRVKRGNLTPALKLPGKRGAYLFAPIPLEARDER